MNPGDSFFKVIVPEINAEKLRIPQAFVFRLRTLEDNIVTLRDRYKNTWQVGVSKVERDWFFDNGWGKLYEENTLERYDFLVFEYKGENMFDFKLFGPDACEKNGVGYLRLEVKEEESEIDDEAEEEETEEDEDKHDDEEHEDINRLGKRKFDMGNKSGVEATTSKRMQNNAPLCYGAEIFESGLVPRPKNPYFVTRSRKERRKNELLIPKNVIEDYNLNLTEKLFLIDKNGNQWETKIMRWKDGRVCLSRGWRGLCVMNNIKIDDVCVCEFVKRKNDEGRDILVYALNI